MLRLDPHARAGPRPERVLEAAQAEEAGLGTAGGTKQLESEPPAVMTALHLLAVSGGLGVGFVVRAGGGVSVSSGGTGGGGAREMRARIRCRALK